MQKAKESNITEYNLIEVKIDTLAKVKVQENINTDTGESYLDYVLNNTKIQARHKKTTIILDEIGHVVYPQSLYLASKLRGEGKIEDTSSIANGLLLYTRWLESTHHVQFDEHGDEIPPQYLTYNSLTAFEEEGAPWQFAEFLIANSRHGESNGDEAWSVSTIRSYMNAVLGFYKWLRREGYLIDRDDGVVTHYEDKLVRKKNTNQHDMLAHIKASAEKFHVQTNNIMKLFPKAVIRKSHQDLKPLTESHEDVFEEYVDQLPMPFPLMFRLSKACGLRIKELGLFPAGRIGMLETEGLDVVPITLHETKFSKPRVVEVPVDIYEELEIYFYSEQRQKNIRKREELNDGSVGNYLFVSNKGKPYTLPTLEKHFNNLRKLIREDYPSWYYRPHDLRATFATRWLEEQSCIREVGYDYLLDELKTLMGHADSSMTEKYITFMKERDTKLQIARNKNVKMQGGNNG